MKAIVHIAHALSIAHTLQVLHVIVALALPGAVHVVESAAVELPSRPRIVRIATSPVAASA